MSCIDTIAVAFSKVWRQRDFDVNCCLNDAEFDDHRRAQLHPQDIATGGKNPSTGTNLGLVSDGTKRITFAFKGPC